jgi:hypothetical protein
MSKVIVSGNPSPAQLEFLKALGINTNNIIIEENNFEIISTDGYTLVIAKGVLKDDCNLSLDSAILYNEHFPLTLNIGQEVPKQFFETAKKWGLEPVKSTPLQAKHVFTTLQITGTKNNMICQQNQNQNQ